MNTVQRLIGITAAAAIVGMALYPPFVFVAPNGVTINLGYAWILDPPTFSRLAGSVNVMMLLAQWAGTLVVAAIGFILAGKGRR